MNPYVVSKKEYSGSIGFRSDIYFDIHHNEAFGYSKDLGCFALNKTPLVDPSFSKIEVIERDVNGFCIKKTKTSKILKYFDQTPLQKEITNQLFLFINNFHYGKSGKQYLSIEYVDKFFTSFKVAEYGSLEPRYLSIARAIDGRVYTGNYPLSDDESIPLLSICMDKNSIVVNHENNPLVFEVELQEEVVRMISQLMKFGFPDEYVQL